MPSLYPANVLHPFAVRRYAGNGRIYGSITNMVATTPYPFQRVRVHDYVTGTLISEVVADAGGQYAFNDLDIHRTYYVVAFDYLHTYADVIKSPVIPEKMP